MIMKKEYIKPEMVVEDLVLESDMLAGSVGETDGPVEPWSNERRGDWGDLWSEDEE